MRAGPMRAKLASPLDSMSLQQLCNLLCAEVRAYLQLVKLNTRMSNQISANTKRINCVPFKGKTPPPPVTPEMEAALTMACGTISAALPGIEAGRAEKEKSIEQIVKRLPAWKEWGESVRGIGLINFGVIVGLTGDLSMYDSPAKVWKRMGLGLITTDAGPIIQRKTKDKKLAEEMGYSPTKRAHMHIVGECFIRASGPREGQEAKETPYADLYRRRKEFELEKRGKKLDAIDIVAHKRAMRYMEKRFLRDLWAVWNPDKVQDMSKAYAVQTLKP